MFIEQAVCNCPVLQLQSAEVSRTVTSSFVNEAGRSVLVLMTGSKIARVELNTVHL